MHKPTKPLNSFSLQMMPDLVALQLRAELGRLGYHEAAEGVLLAYVSSIEGADTLAAMLHPCMIAVIADPGLAPSACQAGAKAILDLPLRRSSIISQLELARSAAYQEEMLLRRYDRLESMMKQRHAVEAAVRILMNTQNYSADEAYAHLRKRAMSQRTSIENIAQVIAAAL